MLSPLAKLLSVYVRLSSEERRALAAFGAHSIRHIPARRNVIEEGRAPGFVRLILEGWACRYKTLADGRRQTLAFLLPGDLCDPNVQILGKMDHSIGAITALTVAETDSAEIEMLTTRYPRIARALLWSELVNASVQREWAFNLGQRSADEHLAHLIAELFHRLRAIDRVSARRCDLPLTQRDLADATGMSFVHVNRVIQAMRRKGLIELERRSLTVPDLARLEAAGRFTPFYLHLEHEGARFDAAQCFRSGTRPAGETEQSHPDVLPPQHAAIAGQRPREEVD